MSQHVHCTTTVAIDDLQKLKDDQEKLKDVLQMLEAAALSLPVTQCSVTAWLQTQTDVKGLQTIHVFFGKLILILRTFRENTRK